MHLEVFSDAICPWCWIGKRRLAEALALPGCEDVTVTWRAFQLYPGLPEAWSGRPSWARFGAAATSGGADPWARAEGERVGLDFAFGRAKVVPNTLQAHRLIRWAHVQQGADGQDRMVETLFARYFTDGEDLGDRDVLADAARDAGFDRDAARSWLDTDEGTAEVRYEVEWSRENGITGVPCFVLPNGFGWRRSETLRFIRARNSRPATRWSGGVVIVRGPPGLAGDRPAHRRGSATAAERTPPGWEDTYENFHYAPAVRGRSCTCPASSGTSRATRRFATWTPPSTALSGPSRRSSPKPARPGASSR